MNDGLGALTEREKATLRLLVAGHDAKSIARNLDLSVHTVNERLRDARRKLGVSSSREAARLLAERERTPPNFFVDEPFGVAARTADVSVVGHANGRRQTAIWPAWFAGGMLVMSLIIAAAIFASLPGNVDVSDARPDQASASNSTSTDPARSASIGVARSWLDLLDHQRWDDSWRAAATVFNSQVSAAQWSAMIQPIRQDLGAVSDRRFQNVTKATSLPNVPPGEYEVIQFETNFARRKAATETIVLAREGSGWKVAGYFIK